MRFHEVPNPNMHRPHNRGESMHKCKPGNTVPPKSPPRSRRCNRGKVGGSKIESEEAEARGLVSFLDLDATKEWKGNQPKRIFMQVSGGFVNLTQSSSDLGMKINVLNPSLYLSP